MPRLHPVPTFEKTVCRNPATGEVIGYSPVTSVNAVKRVIGTARAAQKHWSRLAVEQRAACLFRIRDYMVTQADEIAEIIWQDNGKTRVDALSTEVLPAIMAVDYYAKHAKRFLTDRHTPASNVLLWNKRSKVVRVPYGVVGIISPWNYPFSIPFYEMTRPQVIVDGLLFFAKKNMWWHPHGKHVYQGLTGAINFLYAKQMVPRLKGLKHLLKIVPRYFSTR